MRFECGLGDLLVGQHTPELTTGGNHPFERPEPDKIQRGILFANGRSSVGPIYLTNFAFGKFPSRGKRVLSMLLQTAFNNRFDCLEAPD